MDKLWLVYTLYIFWVVGCLTLCICLFCPFTMSASDAKWEEQKIKRQQQRKNGHSKYLVCGHMRKERKKEAVLSKMHWALTPSTRSIPIDCISYTHTHTYSSYGFYGLDIMCAPNVLIYALFSIIYEHKSPKKCSSSHCNNRQPHHQHRLSQAEM